MNILNYKKKIGRKWGLEKNKIDARYFTYLLQNVEAIVSQWTTTCLLKETLINILEHAQGNFESNFVLCLKETKLHTVLEEYRLKVPLQQ